MNLLDHVTIPSSLDLCRWTRESTDSRAERRLRQTGLTATACPLCGHRATVEECVVQRPGEPAVRRQVLRCDRRANGPRCPVQVLAEVPAEDVLPLDLVPAPAPATDRRCLDCGCGGLIGNRKRCQPCASEAKRRSTREAKRAQRGCVPRATCQDCGCDIKPGKGRKRCRACAEEEIRRQHRESKQRLRAQTATEPPESPQEPREAPAPPETPPDPPEAATEPARGQDDDIPPDATPATEEETSMDTTPTRACATCGACIDHRHGAARYCEDCATERRLASGRESRRLRSAARAVEPAAESAPAPAPSRALRVSVLDLAQQLRTLHPDARALLLDVCALSPERQALLRTVLADAEEACA